MTKPHLPSLGESNPPITVQLKYEDMTARYANHVLLNVTSEEFYLDFSSGVVGEKTGSGAIMPIHTRIVMTPAGARRLQQLLAQALQGPDAKVSAASTAKEKDTK